ncbi:hypothetical protein WJX73_008592 [Symbiochloris irregularis]|uniref:26S proteasome non-ATPase regulatory subunit 10 n=1 Tax=Symbiochloris irregularis TaxID=706552 RepID=A0AAW1PFR6_9CHLO
MALERATEAVRKGDIATLQGLPPEQLRKANSTLDEDGRSILHAAAAGGNKQILHWLLQHGAEQNVSLADDEGWTPLHSAVSAGHSEAVQMLLEAGSDAQALTSGKRTPLHYAASKNPLAIPMLLAAGSRPSQKDATGSTALHRACGAGKVEAVKLLLADQRVNMEDRDREGSTPLLVAVESGQAPVVLYLASIGADLQAANKAGDTPLTASASQGPLQQTMVAIANGDLDIEDVS